jgi:hypothetical protein
MFLYQDKVRGAGGYARKALCCCQKSIARDTSFDAIQNQTYLAKRRKSEGEKKRRKKRIKE